MEIQSYVYSRFPRLKKLPFFSQSLKGFFSWHLSALGRLRSKYRSQYGFWKLGVPHNERFSVTVLIPNHEKILLHYSGTHLPKLHYLPPEGLSGSGMHFYRASPQLVAFCIRHTVEKVNLIIFSGGRGLRWSNFKGSEVIVLRWGESFRNSLLCSCQAAHAVKSHHDQTHKRCCSKPTLTSTAHISEQKAKDLQYHKNDSF